MPRLLLGAALAVALGRAAAVQDEAAGCLGEFQLCEGSGECTLFNCSAAVCKVTTWAVENSFRRRLV
jgi:hypothetical protein